VLDFTLPLFPPSARKTPTGATTQNRMGALNEKPGAMAGAFSMSLRHPHRKPFLAPGARAGMAKTDRPQLSITKEYEIEAAQNDIHGVFWERLAQLQVTTPMAAHVNEQLHATVVRNPPPPKSPQALRHALFEYASLLFASEAVLYPNHPQLVHWLNKLSERIVTTVLGTVVDLEKAGRKQNVSFAHHGLTEWQMREAINLGIEEKTKERLAKAIAEKVKTEMFNATAEKAGPATRRLRSTIESPTAARKMEAYIISKGLGLTEFATEAGTTDRTLRNFRKTGKVRRDIFEAIAKAMGTTKDAFLKD
jgi:hypothetical protein